ncbi:MAG TPA: FecR domain-containing protein [Thermoanaerobaculia bacterium]|nr:FecR domain-containing protein [Thermoanaerobaculia bacterium]
MLIVLVLAVALAIPAAAANNEAGARLGVVDGAATIERAGAQAVAAADEPLLGGDRLITARGARVEAVLAEAVDALVAGDSELTFATLAGASDGDFTANLLRLDRGELLLTNDSGREVRIDTENATVYVSAGSCRIERGEDSTVVVARRGEIELRTRQGAVWLAAGEQASIEGDGAAVVERAGGDDALERWAATLDRRRERLAAADYGDLGLDYYDLGFDAWEVGEPVCVDPRPPGRAVRTRPPHPAADPGPAVATDPGRNAVSPGREPAAAVAAIEVPVDKPWPLDEASTSEPGELPITKPILETYDDDDGWRAASIAGTYAPAASPAKESQPSTAEEAQTAGSSADSATAGSSGADSSPSDSPTFVADAAPASQESVSDPMPRPTQEGSGSSEPTVFAAPIRDEPATEPNC